MKSFYHYLTESTKDFSYRIRTTLNLDNTHDVDLIKKALFKYEPKKIEKPKRIMLQSKPAGFENVRNAEVWVLDFTTHVPASSYILQTELANVLNIPEGTLIVRGENEPIELETCQVAARAEEADDKKPALLDTTDADYSQPADEIAYGNEYTTKLLAHLKKVSDERESKESAHPDQRREGYFNWLKPRKAHVSELEAPADVGPHGNYQASRHKKAKKS